MTVITATKKEFVTLVNGFYALQNVEGKAFALKASKNLKILQTALKDVEVVGQASPEFIELAKQVNAIAQEDTAESKAKIEALEAENEKLLIERQDQISSLEEMLEADLSLELDLISKEELPESITALQISAIDKIII